MARFTVHDKSTAPEESRPHLEAAERRTGFVTNLNAVMAESPELLAGYGALAEQFGKSSLPPAAKHVVWITVSVENGCDYCVAAHSALAGRAKLPGQLVQELRAGKALSDPELEPVRALTASLVARRGWVTPEEVDAFIAAGYTQRHVLDVILGVGMKTLSNYTNHIAHTPLDPAFQGQEDG